ncbi:hypothetical protein WG66_004052, partial [Moniliophthora roreri]
MRRFYCFEMGHDEIWIIHTRVTNPMNGWRRSSITNVGEGW